MKNRIFSSFSRAAETYSDGAAVQKQVAEACATMVPAGQYGSVIEMGAGNGLFTRMMLEKITADRYLAVDISPAMLAGLSMEGRVSLHVADCEHLMLPPASFDLLVSTSCLQWYQEPERSVPANISLLKQGGQFAIALFTDSTFRELREASAETGFGSVLPMRSKRFWVDLFSSIPDVTFESSYQERVVIAPSVSDFLRQHRMTGAVYSKRNSFSGKDKFKQFRELYQERFVAEGGVQVTYGVLYLSGRVR